jgi:hypothetical protein
MLIDLMHSRGWGKGKWGAKRKIVQLGAPHLILPKRWLFVVCPFCPVV